MRGKAVTGISLQLMPGITPAYAGKSRVREQRFHDVLDHPRLCGEKEMKSSPMSSPIGSPPPMRGKVALTGGMANRWGITPAYAGKSARNHFTGDCIKDHPRLCGEKLPNL